MTSQSRVGFWMVNGNGRFQVKNKYQFINTPPVSKVGLTELGLECRRSLGDSLPEDELLALMHALFSEWTLFTWLVGFSNGSKPLCVRCTLTFLSSGMVSRGLMTESVPWQLRVDIFVTHICQKNTREEEAKRRQREDKSEHLKKKTDCAPAFQILPVFHLSVSQSFLAPKRASLLPLC